VNNAVVGLGASLLISNNTWSNTNTFSTPVTFNDNITFAANKTITFPSRTTTATTGQLGFQINGTFNATDVVPTTSNTLVNIGNIVLPSGVWFVQSVCLFTPSASSQLIFFALGSTAANYEVISTLSNYSYMMQTAVPQTVNTQPSYVHLSCTIVNSTVNNITAYLNGGFIFTSTSGTITLGASSTGIKRLVATRIA
jgi:hypothetical protein